MIRVEHLQKSFGQTNAVNDLSFEVQKGEIVGFLGPNGAGKTTTLRLIAGYFAPDKGNVFVNDIPVSQRPTDAQREIGYLAENNPLYKDMLVAELLRFSAALKGIKKEGTKEALDFAVHAVGIEAVFYRPIRELSKGFKQRVGIATALLHRPNILIMDEPTEGLDPNQRTEIRTLIKNLAEARTIIMSTHVMQEASAVCSRLLIINHGKLVADGTSEELSRALRHERIVIVELEGSGIDLALRNMPGVSHVDIESKVAERVRARLMMGETTDVRPELSRLMREHRWTIWHLAEDEQQLEDIFHKLTNES